VWEGKHEHIEIFEIELTEPLRMQVDNREVVDATFFSIERALTLDLFPALRKVIELRADAARQRVLATNTLASDR
jgi:hypothetical protein